jgi:hypothetical protein
MWAQGVGMIVGGSAANVAPCRVVCLDTGSTGVSRQVIQQSATVGTALGYGIAQDAQSGAPGIAGSNVAVAGATGDPILVYPCNNGGCCLGEFGASANIGNELVSDANGRLVPITDSGAGSQFVVAQCIESVTVVGTNYPRIAVQLVGYWKYFAS